MEVLGFCTSQFGPNRLIPLIQVSVELSGRNKSRHQIFGVDITAFLLVMVQGRLRLSIFLKIRVLV